MILNARVIADFQVFQFTLIYESSSRGRGFRVRGGGLAENPGFLYEHNFPSAGLPFTRRWGRARNLRRGNTCVKSRTLYSGGL